MNKGSEVFLFFYIIIRFKFFRRDSIFLLNPRSLIVVFTAKSCIFAPYKCNNETGYYTNQ